MLIELSQTLKAETILRALDSANAKVDDIHDSPISRAQCDSILERKFPGNLAKKREICYFLHILWQIGSLRTVEIGHKHVGVQ
jgi:hypothetical protein